MSTYPQRFAAARSKMERIRVYYNIPAKRGMRVRCFELEGKPLGTITGTVAGAMWITVKLDEPQPRLGRKIVWPFHPLSLDYLEEGAKS